MEPALKRPRTQLQRRRQLLHARTTAEHDPPQRASHVLGKPNPIKRASQRRLDAGRRKHRLDGRTSRCERQCERGRRKHEPIVGCVERNRATEKPFEGEEPDSFAGARTRRCSSPTLPRVPRTMSPSTYANVESTSTFGEFSAACSQWNAIEASASSTSSCTRSGIHSRLNRAIFASASPTEAESSAAAIPMSSRPGIASLPSRRPTSGGPNASAARQNAK